MTLFVGSGMKHGVKCANPNNTALIGQGKKPHGVAGIALRRHHDS